MKRPRVTACVAIGAGICGFQTRAIAISEGKQNMAFEATSLSERIAQLVLAVREARKG